MSSSRRFTQTGSAVVPRRPSWLRVTRCRTSVTMWLARATRCHLSTAICACGRAARIPEAYGADGSITTSWIAVAERGRLLAEPVAHAAAGPARRQPQQGTWPIGSSSRRRWSATDPTVSR